MEEGKVTLKNCAQDEGNCVAIFGKTHFLYAPLEIASSHYSQNYLHIVPENVDNTS